VLQSPAATMIAQQTAARSTRILPTCLQAPLLGCQAGRALTNFRRRHLPGGKSSIHSFFSPNSFEAAIHSRPAPYTTGSGCPPVRPAPAARIWTHTSPLSPGRSSALCPWNRPLPGPQFHPRMPPLCGPETRGGKQIRIAPTTSLPHFPQEVPQSCFNRPPIPTVKRRVAAALGHHTWATGRLEAGVDGLLLPVSRTPAAEFSTRVLSPLAAAGRRDRHQPSRPRA